MKYKYNDKEVKLHGIFQRSFLVDKSMSIGGHNGGVVGYPIAVIETEDGDILEVMPTELTAIKKETTYVEY